MESLVANGGIGVFSTIIFDDEKNMLCNPYHIVCYYANQDQSPTSIKQLQIFATSDAPKELDHIHDDIECHDVEDSHIEGNGDNCDPCNVEFGNLILEDFCGPAIYGEHVEGHDASLGEGVQVESQCWKPTILKSMP